MRSTTIAVTVVVVVVVVVGQAAPVLFPLAFRPLYLFFAHFFPLCLTIPSSCFICLFSIFLPLLHFSLLCVCVCFVCCCGLNEVLSWKNNSTAVQSPP
jgi:hypothetical protein